MCHGKYEAIKTLYIYTVYSPQLYYAAIIYVQHIKNSLRALFRVPILVSLLIHELSTAMTNLYITIPQNYGLSCVQRRAPFFLSRRT